MDPRTHPFARRSQGAFLGLALGDAYGRPLEFIRSPAVRHHPVDTRHLRWTDDTHMALYLAGAIASVDEFDPEHFGRAWREQVIAWSDDPLTPSTAPGNTCLTGAARAKQGLSWRDCGVVHSDGCGAVMRVAALPMRWRGSSLDEAARISAMVTHGHPNAIYSTITLCRILRDLLEGAPPGADTIRRHAERSRRDGHPDVISRAMEQGVKWAMDQRARGRIGALPECEVETGDGGWRSVSCLGLAIAAALAGQSFEEVIDLATRIEGDSDSVGAVAGMLAGAAWPDDLPADWLSGLDEADTIRQTALRMALPPAGVRSSLSDPLRVDVIRYEGREFGMTMAPGKWAESAFGAPWRRDLGLDLASLPPRTTLVCLLTDRELQLLGLSDLEEETRRRGISLHRFPIADGDVPSLPDARAAAALLGGCAGNTIVHCRGGLGRAGTVAARTLVSLGMSAAHAIEEVRRVRSPRAIENRRQERFVHEFERTSRSLFDVAERS